MTVPAAPATGSAATGAAPRGALPAAAAEPARILVVDDNEVNRDLLSRRLRRLGHEVLTAEGGREALEIVRAREMDLVMLDVMMPEVDGYQVLGELKGDVATRHVPVIMVSALDELSSVVRCIELGAEDYLPKPFDPVLLKARVGATLEKKRLRDRERLHARALERELEIGREIQAGFFPHELPRVPGWELAASFRAARQVAGDFYDAFPLGEGRIGLVVGDVCDKGVGAALFMALFRSLLRAIAEAAGGGGIGGGAVDGPAGPALRAVSATNDYIARTHGAANMFATVFFAVLDPAAEGIAYVNAGHEPPMLRRAGGAVEMLMPTGPAVGLMEGLPFEAAFARLAPGDLLLAYTDGVTEARAPGGAMLGEDAVRALLVGGEASAAAAITRVDAALRAFVADGEWSDDVTMLALGRLAAG